MMSPTIESPIQRGDYEIYEAPIRKDDDSIDRDTNADSKRAENRKDFDMGDTRVGNRNSNNRVRFLDRDVKEKESQNFNNNRGQRRAGESIPPFRPIIIGNGPASEIWRDSASGVSARNRSSGLENSLFPHHSNLGVSAPNETETTGERRPSFPSDASFSLPTSTTTLEYLLQRNSDNRLPVRNSEASLNFGDFGGNRPNPFSNEFSGFLEAENRETQSDPQLKVKLTTDKTNPFKTDFKDNMKVTNSNVESELAEPNMDGEVDSPETSNNLSVKKKRKVVRGPDHVGHQFFHVEPCLYSHRMFQRAAKIFQVLKEDDTETAEMKASRRRQGSQAVQKEKIPDMDFKDPHEQIKTFELTFATLKYQHLFHEILEYTGFFHEFSGLREDYSLVCIIMFDLQSRKFQRRVPFPDEELDELCTEIEEAIISRKTRLISQIAKERIKRCAPSIEYLLPEQVRNKDETKSKTPVYGWVNQLKSSLESIVLALQEEGFTELERGQEISEQKTRCYQVDPHCTDLLTFPPHLNMFFKESEWVSNGHLVLQDKSSCLGPQSVQYLLGLDQDVIHVNVGTGMTTGHLASLLRKNSSHSHVIGIGVEDGERAKKALKNLDFLGVKNTKVLQDDFLNVDPEDSRYKNVRVILITAGCSKSAITSPVQFIVSEGEDMQILGELSKAESNMELVGELTHQHEKVIAHALKFPRLRAVVYTTRSRHKAENEHVVTRVLDATNGSANGKKQPFRVTPPVLPFSGDEIGSEGSVVDGRYIRFHPSDKSNGCFVAVISREPEDPKEAARTAIARARSKGMLGKTKSESEAPDTNDDPDNANGSETANEGDAASRKQSMTSSGKNSRKKSSATHAASSSGLKGTNSSQLVKSTSSGGRLKLLGAQKPPTAAAAVGARLYQQGVISKMEKLKVKPHKPEHVRVVKHPAPFSSRG